MGQRDSGTVDSEDEQDIIPDFTDESEMEGSPGETDENEGVAECSVVESSLPRPTVELVQLLYVRLCDIAANIADSPPAHHYVR